MLAHLQTPGLFVLPQQNHQQNWSNYIWFKKGYANGIKPNRAVTEQSVTTISYRLILLFLHRNQPQHLHGAYSARIQGEQTIQSDRKCGALKPPSVVISPFVLTSIAALNELKGFQKNWFRKWSTKWGEAMREFQGEWVAKDRKRPSISHNTQMRHTGVFTTELNKSTNTNSPKHYQQFLQKHPTPFWLHSVGAI